MEVVGKFYDQGEHPQILTLPVFTIKDNVTRDFLLIFLHKTLSQSSKVASLCSQRLSGHAIFSVDMDVFIFLNYCYWVCEHTQVPFSPDCSFKICEKP